MSSSEENNSACKQTLCCSDNVDGAVSTWQIQDLCKGDAVVEPCRDDTMRPWSPGLQLIHLLTGV